MKQFSQIQNSQSSTQTMQVISSLRNEQKRLIHELDDIVSQDTFEKNRQKLTEARTEYTNLADQIAILEYRLRINKKLILDTQKDANQATNNDLTKDFFKEMKTLLPNISKSFNELVTFNKQLFLNKIKYIEQLNADLKSRIKLLKDRQDRLTKNNQDLLSLVATDKLDEYTELSAQLAKRNQEIIQQEQLLLSLNKFEKKKDSLESQLTLLNRKSNETNSVFPKKIEQFNIFFTRFAEKINGERPMLTYNPDVNQFPLAIKDLNGTSTGTRKSLIAAYDFAYQKFAKSENKQIPNFVVHDVMENIEGVNLKTTINIANETGTQYIVALLKEKLDSSGFSKEDQSKYELIKLSSSNRIFDDHRKYRPHVQ
jgi:BMFP domain-containing protein YqiC